MAEEARVDRGVHGEQAEEEPQAPEVNRTPWPIGTRHTATPLEADWALATTTYNRIAADLTGRDGEGQTIRIVLDEGLPHTDNG
ncbi:hypothetical protein [Streptomyces sp. SID2119]|uniref:hypothetical protein n=1 Tax=Streptomyces sp. SID2119 TaxID=2690253 RepID=UPI00139E36DD|nr:hypothetical protein [Streptomyces sp. SID2119]MYW28574.1 hypothetical protein [Streptomyces sp. SID2119]